MSRRRYSFRSAAVGALQSASSSPVRFSLQPNMATKRKIKAYLLETLLGEVDETETDEVDMMTDRTARQAGAERGERCRDCWTNRRMRFINDSLGVKTATKDASTFAHVHDDLERQIRRKEGNRTLPATGGSRVASQLSDSGTHRVERFGKGNFATALTSMRSSNEPSVKRKLLSSDSHEPAEVLNRAYAPPTGAVLTSGEVFDSAPARFHSSKEVETDAAPPFAAGEIQQWDNFIPTNEVRDILRRSINEFYDYRPYFTYWTIFVNVIVCAVSLAIYGFAPFGVGYASENKLMLSPCLAHNYVEQRETRNLWGGMRRHDLIHLGAKYTPCMRRDPNLFEKLAEMKRLENLTGCCVRVDGQGCVQNRKNRCNYFDVASEYGGIGNWYDGTVCGTDPRYCLEPKSISPNKWPKDKVDWPICKNSNMSKLNEEFVGPHMTCELSGRPCCIGMLGECRLLTREECDFYRGSFHEEAFLCSQVSCLREVCGLIPLSEPEWPNQFYRLWLSLFIHGGIVHLVISIVFSVLVMRDLEILAGPVRIGLIYLLSGMAGNLCSGIFLPYFASVGPGPAQFSMIGVFLVELIQTVPVLSKTEQRIPIVWWLFYCIGALVLIGTGLLPWVDNYAHLMGLVCGMLLGAAALPYITFGGSSRRAKVIGKVSCFLAYVVIVVILIMLFYVTPVKQCDACSYFNCVPFTDNICDNMKVDLNDWPKTIVGSECTSLYN